MIQPKKGRISLTAFSCMFVSFIMSQTNMVQNSGFESITGCPSASAQWNLCPGWNNVNLSLGVGPYGSPDFYHTCGSNNTAPPATYAGYCPTHGGNGMMSMVIYNMGYADYREYLSTQLLCPMQPGTTYTLSFWLSNGQTNISPWTIKNIGACFSSSPLSQSGWGVINASPQFEISSNIVSTGWTKYTFTVNPTATWNYLTIGAFRPDNQNNVTLSWSNPGGPASAYANYFIDDIELWRPSNNIVITASSPTVCLGASVTLTASGSSNYTWTNGATGYTATFAPTITSVYNVISSASGTCSASNMASVTVPVVPSVSLMVGSSAYQTCKGQHVLINAYGANSYTWFSGNNQLANTFSLNVSPTATTVYSVQGTTPAGCKGQNTIAITVSECNGVSELIQSEINVFPTIFSDQINFRGGEGNATLVLVNSLGETVFSKEIILQKTTIVEIPLSKTNSGVYTLFLSFNANITTWKLIRE